NGDSRTAWPIPPSPWGSCCERPLRARAATAALSLCPEAAMSDATSAGVEPVMDVKRESGAAQEPFVPSPAVRPALDQLARIEEKTARMEEKYARAEAIMLRLEQKVETATGVTGVLARQDDLD